MKEWKIENLDTLLYYQAAGPCVPKDMFLCVAPVLCLSISTGEKYYMVNSLHSFLNYIWISDRKSSAPFSSPPTPFPSPISHPPSHPIHSDAPVLPAESAQRFMVKQGEWWHSSKMNPNNNYYTLYCMTPTQREEAHKRESGKATGRCSRHL